MLPNAHSRKRRTGLGKSCQTFGLLVVQQHNIAGLIIGKSDVFVTITKVTDRVLELFKTVGAAWLKPGNAPL